MNDIDLLKRNFFNTAVADVYRAIDGDLRVGSFILTFCLIDHLAWIEYGDKHETYNKWVKKRLVPLNTAYKGNDKELYSIRCGLVHNYGPSRWSEKFKPYRLKPCSPGEHMIQLNDMVRFVCLYTLATDVIYAAHLMFEDMKVSIKATQEMRLKQQIKTFSDEVSKLYSEMHPALSVFDSTEVTLMNVKSAYSTKILWGASCANINVPI